jgi:two-component system sensor histidine kinase HupT/HoxJ
MAERPHPEKLIDALGEGELARGMTEAAWIDVIKKMDEVYSDLIRYEVELEKKNAALEQAQQFIGGVVASMSDILIVCDHKGLIQQVNRALLDLTGFTAAQLTGKPLTALLTDDDAAAFRPGGAVREVEAKLKSADGGFTDLVAMNCSPRRQQNRRMPGMVIVGRPVGELRRAYQALNVAHLDLKRAQAHLVQLEKMVSVGQLVAGVAHELNNPISFVYGNVHTLARYRQKLAAYLDAIHAGASEEERERLRETLKIDQTMADLGPLIDGTLEGAERVTEIVRNLRRLSFVNPADRRRLDLAHVARNAVQWVMKAANPKVAIDDQLPQSLWIDGLEGPLHQVIVNLAQNAVDAMEGSKAPVLSLSGGPIGEQTVLVIRDNGPGIAAEHLNKVFDPFFTTKPVGKGTGLGLWVSWSIIRDHGGSIDAANGPDGGAAFTIVLPSTGAPSA